MSVHRNGVHHRMSVILQKDKLRMWATDTNAATHYLHGDMSQLVRTG
ncbi:MAG: hypothetical protein HFE78_07725 [Clostridiales bacterium]|nr:hypothetical protein [Clostridiales bacterium]